MKRKRRIGWPWLAVGLLATGSWLASDTAIRAAEAEQTNDVAAENVAPEEAGPPTFSEALVQAEQAALAEQPVDAESLSAAFAMSCAVEGEAAPDRVLVERYVRTLLLAAPEKLPAGLAAMRTSPCVVARLVGSEVESALALTGRFAEAGRKVRSSESIDLPEFHAEASEWLAAHPDSFAGRLVVDRYMNFELVVWSSAYRKKWASFADSSNKAAAELGAQMKTGGGILRSLSPSDRTETSARVDRVADDIRRRRAERRALVGESLEPRAEEGERTEDDAAARMERVAEAIRRRRAERLATTTAAEAVEKPAEAPTASPEAEAASSDSTETLAASAGGKPVPAAASVRRSVRIAEITEALKATLEVPKALALSRAQAVASWGLSERRWEQMRSKAPTENTTSDESTDALEAE